MRKFLIIAASLAFMCHAHAMDLRVAVWDGAAPYNFVVDGKWRGICIDIYRVIEMYDPQLHFIVNPESMPLTRVQYEVSGGRSDIVCGFRKTLSRETAGFQYLSKPVHISAYRLAVRAGDDVVIDSWDDVKKLGENGLVLILQGHGEIENLKMLGIPVDSSAASAEQNLIKLQAGRGRFFYHRDSYFKSSAYLAEDRKNIKILPKLFGPEPIYIAAGKHVPKATMDKLEAAFNKVVESGELDRIKKSYSLD